MSLSMTVEMLIQSLVAMNVLMPRNRALGTQPLIVDAHRGSHQPFVFWFSIASRMQNFAALMKPRVMLLSVFTAFVGSLWIMADLNENMMMPPELMNLHMQH